MNHKTISIIVFFIILFNIMQSQDQEDTVFNYMYISADTILFWDKYDTKNISIIQLSDYNTEEARKLHIELPVELTTEDQLWDFLIESLKAQPERYQQIRSYVTWKVFLGSFTEGSSNDSFSWEIESWVSEKYEYTFEVDSRTTSYEDGYFNLDSLASRLSGMDEDSEDKLKLIYDVFGIDPDPSLERPEQVTEIKRQILDSINKKKDVYEIIHLDDAQSVHQVIFIQRGPYRSDSIIHTDESEETIPEQLDEEEPAIRNIEQIVFIAIISILIIGLAICIYFILKLRSLKKKTDKQEVPGNVRNLLNNTTARKIIKENNLENKNKDDELYRFMAYLIDSYSNIQPESSSEKIDWKNRYDEQLKETEKLIAQHQNEKGDISQTKAKIGSLLAKNEKLIGDHKQAISSLEEKYNNQIADLNEKHLQELQIQKEEHESIANRLRNDMSTQLSKLQEKQQKDIHSIQDTLTLIKELDNRLSSFLLKFQDWTHETKNNNTIFYLFAQRTLLNLVYSRLYNYNLSNQTHNISEITNGNDDKTNTILEKLSQIESIGILGEMDLHEKQKTVTSIFKHIYNSFNQRINSFPKAFYYGLNDDEKIN